MHFNDFGTFSNGPPKKAKNNLQKGFLKDRGLGDKRSDVSPTENKMEDEGEEKAKPKTEQDLKCIVKQFREEDLLCFLYDGRAFRDQTPKPPQFQRRQPHCSLFLQTTRLPP